MLKKHEILCIILRNVRVIYFIKSLPIIWYNDVEEKKSGLYQIFNLLGRRSYN